MTDVRVAHTADLSPADRTALRELLDAAFDGDFSDEDWDHTLGGAHALAWSGEVLVGHAAVVQRRFVHGGRALRTGYVEGVAVRADHRRLGIGAAVMAPVERIIRAAYDLGALSSSEIGVPFYEARGWQRWQGETWSLTPAGRERTADDDDSVYVLPVTAIDRTGPLTCDWRDGDVW
ncbi:GNAT family N-acetyltransferase [Actinophytocola sp. NPDC049390]|uniref:GNAT family N-acetyltransferase n=1 Tax=Actinophytocola sp. NPDC049390 TaxID=3363894 RepID=UPI003790D1CC